MLQNQKINLMFEKKRIHLNYSAFERKIMSKSQKHFYYKSLELIDLSISRGSGSNIGTCYTWDQSDFILQNIHNAPLSEDTKINKDVKHEYQKTKSITFCEPKSNTEILDPAIPLNY